MTGAAKNGSTPELVALRQHGDLMQSSLSRVLEWLRTKVEFEGQLPYELQMAMLEGGDAIERWTDSRKDSR